MSFLCQKYYGINIEITDTRLFLGKIKPIHTYTDWASEFALAAEFRFMSCQNYADTHTNGKTLNGRREYMFRGKVKEAYCLRGINKPFNFNSVERGCPQCIEKIRPLR